MSEKRLTKERAQGEESPLLFSVAPERIWIQIYSHSLSATDSDPREVHDNGRPVYKYALIPDTASPVPAAEALAEVRELCPTFEIVIRHTSGWKWERYTVSLYSESLPHGSASFEGLTLEEAMQKVREWAAEQKGAK